MPFQLVWIWPLAQPVKETLKTEDICSDDTDKSYTCWATVSVRVRVWVWAHLEFLTHLDRTPADSCCFGAKQPAPLRSVRTGGLKNKTLLFLLVTWRNSYWPKHQLSLPVCLRFLETAGWSGALTVHESAPHRASAETLSAFKLMAPQISLLVTCTSARHKC